MRRNSSSVGRRALFATAIALAGLSTSRAQTITQIIDSSGAGEAGSLASPTDLAVDDAGNVYVTGWLTHNAFKITPDGTITEIIDASGDGNGNNLDQARGLAVDGDGNVFVTGYLSDNVFKITPAGVVTEIIDASGDGANVLDRPHDVAVDSSGNVFVPGALSDNAFKITPGGTITEIIDITGDGAGNVVHLPQHVTVDAADNVYISGGGSNVFKITPGGTITEIIDGTGDGTNVLHGAGGTAVDGAGNVFVGGTLSDNGFKITPGGVITEIVDRTGDGISTFDGPVKAAVDADENVYFSTASFDTVFKITPSGTITTIIGPSGDGAGNLLDRAWGLDVLLPDTVYVSGLQTNNAFRIGTGSFSFCNDADGALSACPCANPGNPDSGCDIPQGTGGVELTLVDIVAGIATLSGTGFHPGGTPSVIALRASQIDASSPVVFGDGLRCVGMPVTRLSPDRAVNGVSIHSFGHGAGPGVFYYQLWFRSAPIAFCDAAAAFNLSSGRALIW